MAHEQTWDLVVVGGGAAGFFGAIVCATTRPGARVLILERSRRVLQKVKISGGGRCNVTHDTSDRKWLATNYPRGDRALIGPLHTFGPADIVQWFAAHGVDLKTEADGRMFPVTDDSQTIIDCLRAAANDAGVVLRTRRGVERIDRGDNFALSCEDGEIVHARHVLLATGGTRAGGGDALARGLGHALMLPVPSLFTFEIRDPRLADLQGVSVEDAAVQVKEAQLRQRGALVVTHWGLSGPGVLRLSAWGARALAEVDYRFTLHIDWLPGVDVAAELTRFAGDATWGRRQVAARSPFASLPRCLWQRLVHHAGIDPTSTWADLPRAARAALATQLTDGAFAVTGQSVNKDEFVTCGGVHLNEVDMRTMHSHVCDGLYFAGELLDIDGITGGFNFQNAWTTGFLAGTAVAARCA